MGLTIRYNGRFNRQASLRQMIEEVEEIVKAYRWEYTIMERDFPGNSTESEDHDDKVYGISVMPPESEPIDFCFLSNGRMISPMYLKFHGDPDDKKFPEWIYTKTQFAGPEVHIQVINLLRHISKKYFSEFNVKDEGDYWETNDEQLLRKTFGSYTTLINTVSDAIQYIPINEGESLEAYFKRILKKNHYEQKT